MLGFAPVSVPDPRCWGGRWEVGSWLVAGGWEPILVLLLAFISTNTFLFPPLQLHS